MNPLATILASGVAVFGPIVLAGIVIQLSKLRRERRYAARRPIGPLGNRIRDLKL